MSTRNRIGAVCFQLANMAIGAFMGITMCPVNPTTSMVVVGALLALYIPLTFASLILFLIPIGSSKWPADLLPITPLS